MFSRSITNVIPKTRAFTSESRDLAHALCPMSRVLYETWDGHHTFLFVIPSRSQLRLRSENVREPALSAAEGNLLLTVDELEKGGHACPPLLLFSYVVRTPSSAAFDFTANGMPTLLNCHPRTRNRSLANASRRRIYVFLIIAVRSDSLPSLSCSIPTFRKVHERWGTDPR